MRRLARAAVLPAALAALGCGPPAEDVASFDAEIVNGRMVTKVRPAVGYLAGRDDAEPHCTATLVEPTYVVTAAHCVRGIHASTLVFGTGVFRASGPARVSIAYCKSNPSYNDTDSGIAYDFAYCKLVKPITTIEPLAFVADPAFDASYLAMGYGQTDGEDDESAGPRKQLVVHRVDPNDEPLLDGLEAMLATTSKAGATCYGDSGGPLLVLEKTGVARVAGVLQSGVGYVDEADCQPGGIDLYAPVAKNLAFFATRD